MSFEFGEFKIFMREKERSQLFRPWIHPVGPDSWVQIRGCNRVVVVISFHSIPQSCYESIRPLISRWTRKKMSVRGAFNLFIFLTNANAFGNAVGVECSRNILSEILCFFQISR
mmetsp:Transcript_22174/g.28692  ORF Transcript_22174/g.28692 Transcript_22174/m.28692 type:complete len:114 (+) Transcript_22174:389-730(+)